VTCPVVLAQSPGEVDHRQSRLAARTLSSGATMGSAVGGGVATPSRERIAMRASGIPSFFNDQVALEMKRQRGFFLGICTQSDLERLVIDRIRTFFADADAVTQALPPRRHNAPSLKRALGAAAEFIRVIAAEDTGKTFELLRPLIARAQVHPDRIDIELAADRVTDVLLGGGGLIGDDLGARHEADPEAAAGDDRCILLTIEVQLQRAGMEMRLVIDGVEIGAALDDALVRLLTRAHSLARRLATNTSVTLEEAGAAEDMGAPYAARLMRLNFLAPDIVVAILNGRQPAALTATKLIADARLLLRWTEQRKGLGFA
jgi:site-specific DNA recombinase